MSNSVFVEARFWILVALSVVLPFALYAVLMIKRAISSTGILLLAFALVCIAGVDVYLLQILGAAARATPSISDDAVFASEVSIALYLLPALFGGLGINMISHVLHAHLVTAQKRFADDHPERK